MQRAARSVTVSLLLLICSTALSQDLPTVSSWIGNTWDGVRHAQMPLTADDIGVSGDGIVTMTTHYNEGGLSMLVMREGRPFGFGMHATETLHTAGSPDGTRLFVAVKGEYGRGVAQFTHFGELYDPALCSTKAGPLNDREITGLAWHGKYLYAAESSPGGFNGLWVYEAANWAPDLKPAFKLELPGKAAAGRVAVDAAGDPWLIQGREVAHYRLKTGEEIAKAQLPPGAQPAALAVDKLDRLLVADRGPDQNIKLFDGAGHPVGTVGANGGFTAEPVPGVIGPLRFDKPLGLCPAC